MYKDGASHRKLQNNSQTVDSSQLAQKDSQVVDSTKLAKDKMKSKLVDLIE